ncbi:molybdopterin converting factor subunit 1 [Salipaludibacillus neizhouensis]|uniref:Molybdopterin synthase sulfur carrier subunit n=1 Tax=Salipaludibacillus neizhouensis TaxID=885475 RepID=A0A3A9KAH6_9BACI|nr:molybdopterin converting factor subunit 1 [Salipaludibacillus neizhouensis]RKL67750.1 molybdopterin converting factor subunit 1 [Salipaludibacillus neizhouensis]
MIKILLFAELEEKTGKRELSVSMEMTVEEIRKKLLKDYPHVTGLASAMAAVNEEFADESVKVRQGDLIAFIPPVSGG